jgi:hypothetical protein
MWVRRPGGCGIGKWNLLSDVEVVTLRYNGDITAMVVKVEIVVVSLRRVKSIWATLVALERGDVADARRFAVVRNANPSVARMNRSATPSWRSDLEMILFQSMSNNGIDEDSSRSWPSKREIFYVLRDVGAWLFEMRLCSRNTPLLITLTQLEIHLMLSLRYRYH